VWTALRWQGFFEQEHELVGAAMKGGELVFTGVVERGGHSTYRVRLPAGKDHEYFLKYWESLHNLGCTYEGASGRQRLYTIDVPSVENTLDVYNFLQEQEDMGVWEFEEAHYYKPH
jgi:hypothetical protein